jgi:hypothetical protein
MVFVLQYADTLHRVKNYLAKEIGYKRRGCTAWSKYLNLKYEM